MKDDCKVLLVDDDEDILWINQLILQEEGFVVDTCNDPVAAYERSKTDNYQIFVLDYVMPNMNELNWLRKLSHIIRQSVQHRLE